MYKAAFYRVWDIILCLILFIPLIIILAILAILILFIDGKPLFFLHKRVGKDGKEFLIYKFKTYPPIQKANEDIIVDHSRAERTTSTLGRIYRDHGWDELPQILNIFLGEMSFIGPRPLVKFTYQDLKKRYPKKVKIIDLWQNKRQEVLPGLSGWHQIHIDNSDVITYDLEFIDEPSLTKRFKILVVSIAILIFGKSRVLGKQLPTSNQYEIR